jgi:hypothetical protein
MPPPRDENWREMMAGTESCRRARDTSAIMAE